MHIQALARFSRSSSILFGTAFAGLVSILAGCSGASAPEAESASLCAPGEAVAAGDVAAKGMRLNGMRMNGIALNGINFNGVNLNGVTLNGISFNGAKFNGIRLNGPLLQGTKLNGISINGPVLQGTTLNGITFNGADLAGVELVGELSDGTTIPIFIDAVRQNPDPANADVVLYEVSYGADHAPLCGHDAGGAPLLATALANTWDPATGNRIDSKDRFTFACQGGALYKCVAAGYKPWKSVESASGPASLADLHQACTRMIRADYCGDGRSFTRDGTEIDLYDGLAIQTPASLDRASFAFEAAWGPNGATCVSKTRYPLPALPQCVIDRMSDSCETTPSAQPGAVGLMNRSSKDNACLVQ